MKLLITDDWIRRHIHEDEPGILAAGGLYHELFKEGSTMTVRAKLKLTSITETSWGRGIASQKSLRFDCQYDASIPEDQRFQKATPTGKCELVIDNPAALAQFELGADYYVDFTPAS